MAKNIYVKPYETAKGNEKWQVWKRGNKQVWRSFDERREAIAFGRDAAEDDGVRFTVYGYGGEQKHSTDYS